MRFALLALLLALAAPAVAQEAVSEPTAIWFYVDDRGQMHFVDRYELIPDRYKRAAQQTNLSTSGASAPARSTKAAAPPPKATPKPQPTPTPTPAATPSASERLAAALQEQQSANEELARLEEGWSAGGESEDALQERVVALEARLDELAVEIPRLKAAAK